MKVKIVKQGTDRRAFVYVTREELKKLKVIKEIEKMKERYKNVTLLLKKEEMIE